jgi:hypothetical protein
VVSSVQEESENRLRGRGTTRRRSKIGQEKGALHVHHPAYLDVEVLHRLLGRLVVQDL